MTPAVVLLNPAARQGTAERRYSRVASEIAARFEVETIRLGPDGRFRDEIGSAVCAGVRTFLAAGGDGTVNALLSALLERRGGVPLRELTLGAVGLGSSNDFHKPVRRRLAGVPVRLDLTEATPYDVGRVRTLTGGRTVERYFLVSASLGLVAAANRVFNGGGAVLSLLKRRATGLAIAYAALRTLLGFENVNVLLDSEELSLTNLSVSKSRHLAGSLAYDTPVGPADGLLAVNVCEGMSRMRALQTLMSLSVGRFQGLPGTRHGRSSRLDVQSERPLDVELDGEIVTATRMVFDVLPERIFVCG